MAVAHVAKVTFTRGEVTPLVHARADMEMYRACAKTLQNWYVLKEGGIRRRSGTKYLGAVKSSTLDTRLVDFVFSSSQTYALEMGNLYTRFWSAGANVVGLSKTITGATKANPCVVTAAAHTFSNGDQVFFTSVLGMSQLNNRLFTIANVATNTFELQGVNSTAFGTYVSGGTASRPYEVVSPYATATLRSIQWAQSFDVMYFAHASTTVPTKKLKRTSHTSWAWSDLDFADGPYLPINDQENLVTLSAVPFAGTTVTCTHANTSNINGGTGFATTDVGRHYRVQVAGAWSWGRIASRVSSTVVTVTFVGSGFSNNASAGTWGTGVDLHDGTVTKTLTAGTHTITAADVGKTLWIADSDNGQAYFAVLIAINSTNVLQLRYLSVANASTVASKSWQLGAFSQTTGWPGAISWYQGRLFLGRTDSNPNVGWYSRSGFPENFAPSDYDGTVVDSHGGMLAILGRADEILWLQEAPRLQAGTTGAIRSLGASDTNQAFGPRNISQRLEVAGGVQNTRPVSVGPSTLHVSKFGRRIHDLYFDYNANTLVAPELSTTSEHMFDLGVKELWFQQHPDSQLWSILNDGTLVATAHERYEKVVGFARQPLDGGNVVSGCTIPGTTQDDFYMVVRRTVNGTQVQYMEILQPRFLRNSLVDAWFSDCGGQYSGTATNTVSGINWLLGETVNVLADGVPFRDLTISALGVLTLPTGVTAAKITFGKAITNVGGVLSAPTDAPDGSSKGRKMRVVNVIADVYETLGLKFTSDRGQTDSLAYRSPNALMGAPDALITGARKVKLDGSWSSEGEFTWGIDDPVPGTIRALNIGLDYEP